MVGILQRWLSVATVALLGLAAVIATAPGAAAAVGSVASAAHAYDAAAYVYDTPAQLSSPDIAASYVRGSPSGPDVASWGRSVSTRGCCTAANTAGTATSANAGLDAFELSMSRTVASHLGETGKSGALARPYGNSRLTIQTIMDAVEPVPDPGGVPGALRWDAPGVMNGSQGTWQLVVDPNSNTILHYLFAGAK